MRVENLFKRFTSWIRQWSQERFGIRPLAESIPLLEQWCQGPLGSALLQEEQQQVDRVVNYLFGYHLMQLSISRQLDLSRSSTINHRFSFTPAINACPEVQRDHKVDQLPQSFADPEKIPLSAETIDVAVLHHVLDFSQHPHQLLRETARVLIPRGYAVIVGFNPFSWFGVCKTFARPFSRRPHWRHHSLRLGRVIDWLRLLDFEPVEITQGYYRFPIDHPGVIARTQWYERLMKKINLPIGGFYVIVARKDVIGMTPIKPVWKKFSPIEGLVGNHRAPTSRSLDLFHRDQQTAKKLQRMDKSPSHTGQRL